ncbi:gamma-glutamyltranspeptidase [Phaffia rhodozyma]|uniref:Gamma-glutamyltranspeptidase n=1 Tax=Phaffia rhodozyma TaxID=264483 RepID=A0A0F7SVJ0_PHARH|nr:gamma-glutamyltranspeptidase [Phaffia rhodozyma]
MSNDWSRVYPNVDVAFATHPSRRSVVFSTKGLVAASQPLAVSAGIEVLNKGGNAADAAVATAAALNVTEPSCTGIGGDVFCLYYNASDKTVKAINGSGRSPAKLTMEYARSVGINGRHIPLDNLNSVTVPGATDGWCTTIKEFGSGKLSMREILDPAIRLAEEGVPVSELHSNAWQRSVNLIKNASPSADSMLLDGRAPNPGEIFRFPDLANTFKEVAEKGRDGFYKGRIAQAIVDLIQSKGGVMELSDLEAHHSANVEPISYTYKNDCTIYECPPNGQGLTALLALGILEQIQATGKIQDLTNLDHNSVEYLHVLIEALRLSFADTRYYVSDPDKVHVPVAELLSEEYLKTRAKLFDPSQAVASVHHGKPCASTDTVYFTTCDKDGNACSFIASNYAGFGTGAIPAGCGFTLQNRGSGFTLEEGHPNELKGGKRPYHTIIPAMALRGDELFLSYGVMGGFMQPQGHVQVLLNMLRGMTPQEALDAPRFCISAGLPDAEVKTSHSAGDVNSEVYIEEGIPIETVEALRDMGHDARQAKGFARATLGRGQIIQQIKDKTTGRRVWAAGSDLRADGHAAAQI